MPAVQNDAIIVGSGSDFASPVLDDRDPALAALIEFAATASGTRSSSADDTGDTKCATVIGIEGTRSPVRGSPRREMKTTVSSRWRTDAAFFRVNLTDMNANAVIMVDFNTSDRAHESLTAIAS
jgi:hypothetical protein